MERVFSVTELTVLKLLGKKEMTISELADKYFFDCDKRPLNPNAVVSSSILRINKKCEYYDFDWHIEGNGSGRGGKRVRRKSIIKQKGEKHGEKNG